jgi:hypothetical protein
MVVAMTGACSMLTAPEDRAAPGPAAGPDPLGGQLGDRGGDDLGLLDVDRARGQGGVQGRPLVEDPGQGDELPGGADADPSAFA